MARDPVCVVVGLHNNGLGVVRALGRHGVPVVAIDTFPLTHYARTRFAKVVSCVDMKGLGLIEQLRTLGRGLDQPAVLILTMDRSVMLVSEHRAEIEPFYRHSLPPHDLVMRFMNKAEIARHAEREGFLVPRTFEIFGHDDLDACLDRVTFPCILKPQIKTVAFVEHATRKAFHLHSRQELADTYRRLAEWDPAMVVQEWVDGPDRNLEFVLFYLDGEGRALGEFAGRKIRQYIPYCGTACSAEPWDDPTLVEHARRFFRGTGYTGFGAIEFKRDQQGRYFLVEPTVGRTEHIFMLAVANGVNLPLIGYRHMAGQPLPAAGPRPARPSKYVHPRRDLKAARVYAKAGELTATEWVRSVRGPRVYPVFAWDDPKPFLRHVALRAANRPRRIANRLSAVGEGLKTAWRALRHGDSRGACVPRHSTEHLAAALDWICRAQDVSGDGVSRGFGLRDSPHFPRGWQPPYPETTGYIIVTMLDCARRLAREDLRSRAQRMADWCRTMQLPDGGIPGGVAGSGKPSVVFNTGMVLQGWAHLYLDRPDAAMEGAMRRAMAFLVRAQSEDGAWRQSTNFDGEPRSHTYDVLVAWPLLMAGQLLRDERAIDAGRRNVAYALSKQRANGWFEANGMRPRYNDAPFTHNIGYAIEGLLECGLLCGETDWIAGARRAADGALGALRPGGFLPGRLDAEWRSPDHWACLTGTAQLAESWFRLARLTGEARYFEAARSAIEYLKRSHDLSAADPGIRGGLAGSQPVDGRYVPHQYPNWAAKYFVDALLLDVAGEPGGQRGATSRD